MGLYLAVAILLWIMVLHLAFLHLVHVNDCGGSLGEWGGFMIAVGE